MEVKSLILQSRSKENAELIASYICQEPKRFEELIPILLSEDNQLVLRASMVLAKTTDQNPEIIVPYLPQLLKSLKADVIDGVKRSIVRALQEIRIPRELLGEAADVLFSLMEDHSQPIAIKVFSMTSLYGICLQEPELSNELKLIIEAQMPYGSTGFKNRGSKILKKLNQLIASY